MIGGVNKGRTNERDLINAENFANQIKRKNNYGDKNGKTRPISNHIQTKVH